MGEARRSRTNATEAFEDWDWRGRASELVRAVEKHVGLESIYWRTNPNCPFEGPFDATEDTQSDDKAWINSVSEKQAAAVRDAVRRGVPPWDKIGLIDWRQEYSTTQ